MCEGRIGFLLVMGMIPTLHVLVQWCRTAGLVAVLKCRNVVSSVVVVVVGVVVETQE